MRLAASKGTPPEVIAKLHDAFKKVWPVTTWHEVLSQYPVPAVTCLEVSVNRLEEIREKVQRLAGLLRAKGYSGEWKLHHQGGPIGYQPRDYRAHLGTPDLVAENQAFCWNPSITGSKSEDTMLATARGPELITKPVLFPTLILEVEGVRFVRPAILEMS